MKRYDLEAEDCMGGWASRDVMNERAEGDWVRYEDAAARIAELEADLEDWRFTNKVDEMERELTRRDARIAELEAAIDKLAHKGGGSYINVADYKALIEVRNKSLHK